MYRNSTDQFFFFLSNYVLHSVYLPRYFSLINDGFCSEYSKRHMGRGAEMQVWRWGFSQIFSNCVESLEREGTTSLRGFGTWNHFESWKQHKILLNAMKKMKVSDSPGTRKIKRNLKQESKTTPRTPHVIPKIQQALTNLLCYFLF